MPPRRRSALIDPTRFSPYVPFLEGPLKRFKHGQAKLGTLVFVTDPDVYKTQSGTILRVVHADDGGLKVEMLKEGAWIAARIGMAGLRLSPSTRKLTERQVRALPD
jgi:hypothetical protein